MNALGSTSIASFLKTALDLLWYIAIAGLAAGLVAGLVGLLFFDLSNLEISLPAYFEPDPAAYRLVSQPLGVQEARIGDAFGTIMFRNPHDAVLLFLGGACLLVIGVVLAIVYQLRRIFATLCAGQPFVRDNAARIRFVGLAIIGGETAQSLLLFLETHYLAGRFSADGLALQSKLDLNPAVIFVGLVLLVLAEVFRLGAELREEQELTV